METSIVDAAGMAELIVLAGKGADAICRSVATREDFTLRASNGHDVVPGEIVRVRVKKVWRFGTWFVSGKIESSRLDVAALGLTPLRLEDMGMWDPETDYWYERDDHATLPEWMSAIRARGPRPMFEMEVVPRFDLDDERLLEAIDMNAAGLLHDAIDLVMELVEEDLRCLDAHAHLGSFLFNSEYLHEEAVRHFEAGLRIGELSLGPAFDGVLAWGHIDNRPFLRCLHGHALCLWRMGRKTEAAAAFARLLSLNPMDNQGARSCLDAIHRGEEWSEDVLDD